MGNCVARRGVVLNELKACAGFREPLLGPEQVCLKSVEKEVSYE